MERMKHTGDYELDEINMLEQECADLEEENKDLINELEYVRTIKDSAEQTLKEIREENKKLKENIDYLEKEKSELERDLEHRDSFFSIMRDVLANNDVSNEELAAILYCVVHYECGDNDMSKRQIKIIKDFWGRKYV